jgi:hypothetical protein
MRCSYVFPLCLLLTACTRSSQNSPRARTDAPPKSTAPRASQPVPKAPTSLAARATPAPASAPTSAPASGPASAPAASAPAGSSVLTPTLLRLVRALQAHKGQAFTIRAELERGIPGFAGTDDGKHLPDQASVEVFEVTQGSFAMAFVQVTPKGYVACSDKNASEQAVHALHIRKDADGSEHLAFSAEGFSASETKLFDGKGRKVVFPPFAARVPVFELHFDYQPRCAEEVDTMTGKMVEVYHLVSAERIGEPIFVDGQADVPGRNRLVQSRAKWLPGKATGTALLVVTQVSTEIISPCTGAPDGTSSACRDEYTCDRTTQVVAVATSDGSEEPEQKLEALRRREPALATLPRDGSGKTQTACRRLGAKN